jgi:hypothetical protein
MFFYFLPYNYCFENVFFTKPKHSNQKKVDNFTPTQQQQQQYEDADLEEIFSFAEKCIPLCVVFEDVVGGQHTNTRFVTPVCLHDYCAYT